MIFYTNPTQQNQHDFLFTWFPSLQYTSEKVCIDILWRFNVRGLLLLHKAASTQFIQNI
jgi:hypothetical protein